MARLSLVTGGTSGLGAAFADCLAKGGSNLVLVARDVGRLDEKATELQTKFGVAVEVIAADLAESEGVGVVSDRLASNESQVDMLVNNAGFGFKGAFVDVPVERHLEMMQVNANAVLALMHAALRAMTKRNRGDIVNVSSVAGFTPGARSSGTYGASKAFVTAITEGLATATAGTNIHISATCPGWMSTEFHERGGMNMTRLPKWLWLEPQKVAEQALADHAAGKVLSIPGWPYKAIVWGALIMPRRAVYRAGRGVGRRTHSK